MAVSPAEFAEEWSARRLVWTVIWVQGFINLCFWITMLKLDGRLDIVEQVTRRWLELVGN